MASMNTKLCYTCHEDLPVAMFHSHKGHPDGLYNHCKPCYNAGQREKYRQGYLRDQQVAYRRRYTERLKVKRRIKRYGVTLEEYERRLAEQGGRCAICRGVETYEHNELCVDHCHASGAVRGLLCSKCNKALGGFNDDPHLLRAALRYLAHPPTSPDPA